MGSAVLAAAAAYARNEDARGQTPRDDGFFGDDSADGADFVEGVLLSVKDSFEEKKVPYLGNLLANVAFNPDVDAATANTALRLADAASWLELVVLGIFADETYPMPASEMPIGTNWSTWTQLYAVRALLEPPRSLLQYARTVGEHGLPGFDLNLNDISLTSGGALLSGLMELTTIERAERDPIHNTLTSSS